MRLLGIDPGLRNTGWGVIDVQDNHLSFVAGGIIVSDNKKSLAERLMQLSEGIERVIVDYRPAEAAVEETFVNKNAASTLKLGQARGVALLIPAQYQMPVAEYSPNLIKKSVVGTGHASKEQVKMMVNSLLPGCDVRSSDTADALAVAICHGHQKDQLNMVKQLLNDKI